MTTCQKIVKAKNDVITAARSFFRCPNCDKTRHVYISKTNKNRYSCTGLSGCQHVWFPKHKIETALEKLDEECKNDEA